MKVSLIRRGDGWRHYTVQDGKRSVTVHHNVPRRIWWMVNSRGRSLDPDAPSNWRIQDACEAYAKEHLGA